MNITPSIKGNSDKYELVSYMTKTVEGIMLFRIRALRSFSDVKQGQLGGWISQESYLGSSDNSWVYDDAAVLGGSVYDNVKIFNNAKIYSGSIYGNAWVYGDASVRQEGSDLPSTRIYGNARIYGTASVSRGDISDNVQIFDNAKVQADSTISGNAKLYGNAEISGHFQKLMITDNAEIFGNAKISSAHKVNIYGEAQIYGNAKIFGGSISGRSRIHEQAVMNGVGIKIFDNARISGNASVNGSAQISGDAEISDHAYISGGVISENIRISGNASIGGMDDYFVVNHIGPENEILIAFKQKDGSIMVSHRDFNGVIEAFEYIIKERHENSKYLDIYLNQIETIKKQLK